MTPDEWYDREYAKQEGRERARDDAARRRANERDRALAARARAKLYGCLILLALPVLGCGGFMVIGLVGSLLGVRPTSTQPATATTTTASHDTQGTQRFEEPTQSQPTRARLTEARPTTPAATPTTRPTEPKPVTVTLTPLKGYVIALGSAKYIAGEAQKSVEVRAGWVEKGNLRLLTDPAAVEVLNRDKDFCRVKLDGKEWYVETRFVPAK